MRESTGRRAVTESTSGRYIGSRMPRGEPRSIALDATLRAAAPHQKTRDGGMALNIEKSDIREKVHERRTGCTILFAVDASGSMGARKRMSAVKGAMLSLLTDAYQKRDRVALISMRGSKAELLVPPTGSVETAERSMRNMPVGGKTPLSHGLLLSSEVLSRERARHPESKLLLVLMTDGRGNVSASGGKPMSEARAVASAIREGGIDCIVIDTEEGGLSLGMAKGLAEASGGKYIKLENLEGSAIAEVAKAAVRRS